MFARISPCSSQHSAGVALLIRFRILAKPVHIWPPLRPKKTAPKKPAQPPPTQHVCHFLLPLSAPLQGLEVGDRSPILGTALAHLQVQTCIARHLRKGESAAGQSLELWPLTCTSDACTGEVCVLLTCLRRCYFRGFLAGWDVRPPQNSVHLIQS